MKHWIAAASAIVLAAGALAHSGVTNPTVKARMDLMGQIKEATATLGDMAKGTRPFDAKQAKQARNALLASAKQVPAAFRAPETDPRTESLPAIWQNWSDFTDQARSMKIAARQLDPVSLESLRAGLGAIGKSCSSCHESYRLKN